MKSWRGLKITQLQIKIPILITLQASFVELTSIHYNLERGMIDYLSLPGRLRGRDLEG